MSSCSSVPSGASGASLPVVLVLAAGAGRRFRVAGGVGSKLHAMLAGHPVLDWTLAAVQASGLPWTVVTADPAAGTGIEAAPMGASIVRGVAATPRAPGWLVLPGDLPLVSPALLQAVAQRLQREAAPRAVVRPRVADDAGHWQPGHPVGFGPGWRAALLGLQAAAGARALVAQAQAEGTLHWLDVADPGCVQDVDTPAALAAAEARLRHEGRGGLVKG
ncbi:NTP transferase domain-containing protein [Ideonella sp. B7]|uniref:nucleotidyltransferase family protein n=1 Tax=Ideonella benzenivorans TaxID=2831643 RepID=UPI001CEC3796|nr:NTP transferase domain-containing protein [Ideonella benzenivorans]MCA6215444.1 NTP transferase domain-containing protein [Ideonella benzenivorans]